MWWYNSNTLIESDSNKHFIKIEFTKLISCKIVGSEIVSDDIEKGVLIIEYILLRTTNFWKYLYLTFYKKKTRNVAMYIKSLTEMSHIYE